MWYHTHKSTARLLSALVVWLNVKFIEQMPYMLSQDSYHFQSYRDPLHNRGA